MKTNNVLKTIAVYVITAFSLLILVGGILAAKYMGSLENKMIIILLTISILLFIIGMTAALYIDYSKGYYECKYCKGRIYPTFAQYVFAPHIFSDRKLKCTRCNKKGYAKRITY